MRLVSRVLCSEGKLDFSKAFSAAGRTSATMLSGRGQQALMQPVHQLRGDVVPAVLTFRIPAWDDKERRRTLRDALDVSGTAVRDVLDDLDLRTA